jgi:hypothetical protein
MPPTVRHQQASAFGPGQAGSEQPEGQIWIGVPTTGRLPGAAWLRSSMMFHICAMCIAADDAEEELGSEDDARSSDEEFGGELYDTGEGREAAGNGEDRPFTGVSCRSMQVGRHSRNQVWHTCSNTRSMWCPDAGQAPADALSKCGSGPCTSYHHVQLP